MFDWITQNTDLLRLLVSIVTALVWIVYLHLLLVSFMRQRQSVILINRSASKDENARCFITNMSAEPIYLMDVIAELEIDGETHAVRVTEREELGFDEVSKPSEKTNQGPLDGGGFVDVGSFYDLFRRAEQRLGMGDLQGQIDGMTLIAVAASNHAKNLVAGSRHFRAMRGDDPEKPRFVPTDVMTDQVKSMFKRRRLKRRLQNWLDD